MMSKRCRWLDWHTPGPVDTRDALHTAFAIIANARNCLGDGDRDPLLAAQWHEAAQRFMDDYNTHLDVYIGPLDGER